LAPDVLSLIYESQLSTNQIRPQVLTDVKTLLLKENHKDLNLMLDKVLSFSECNQLLTEGWGTKVTTLLSLIAGLIIGQISPTSNSALSARNSIMSMLEGGLSSSQSWELINKMCSDKYGETTNFNWMKYRLKNFNTQDPNHRKLIKLIGNTITQDPLITKPIKQMSDAERTSAIHNSGKLQAIVLKELGIDQDEPVMTLTDMTNVFSKGLSKLSKIQSDNGMKP